VDKMTRSMELWNSINSMKDQGLTTEEPFLAILVFLNSINSMKSYFLHWQIVLIPLISIPEF
jgi:hypothetical protein